MRLALLSWGNGVSQPPSAREEPFLWGCTCARCTGSEMSQDVSNRLMLQNQESESFHLRKGPPLPSGGDVSLSSVWPESWALRGPHCVVCHLETNREDTSQERSGFSKECFTDNGSVLSPGWGDTKPSILVLPTGFSLSSLLAILSGRSSLLHS